MILNTTWTGLRKTALGIAVGSAALGLAGPAKASGFGCQGLLESDALPSIEGDGGMFYRVEPDLMMAQGLTDGNIAQIAALSEALASRGTTLIYLPMPTKALGQPWQLPPLARDLGFDIDVATTVYDESLKRLEGAGVAVVNARAALARSGHDTPSYLGPDVRPSPLGTQAIVEAVTAVIPAKAGVTPRASLVAEGEDIGIASAMRLDLQEHCASPLPPLKVPSVLGDQPADLMEGGPTDIAVLSTRLTGDPALGFAARLQAGTGQSVASFAVPDGGAFAAIASYLTSDAFQASPPKVLVWEHPIWRNLAEHGDGPMRELVSAAGADCSVPVPLMVSGDGQTLRADLTVIEKAPDALLFQPDGTGNASVTFAFENDEALTRSRWLERHEGAKLTGRFFAPMSGLWEAGAVAVNIQPTGSVGPKVALFACYDAEGE
ncbi:alginate O-acetyltransferase AlgX-related protein [Pacificoceanicola onchidii]|uniref:alginate O-acetyltransferase AlgX-related protein n=1 Tax=Pacificoceanicola onchidii TaxID=2562685 RepID=UPI0010A462F9|nr:hypothetical protein [Pacificoceanicola onchidii]